MSTEKKLFNSSVNFLQTSCQESRHSRTDDHKRKVYKKSKKQLRGKPPKPKQFYSSESLFPENRKQKPHQHKPIHECVGLNNVKDEVSVNPVPSTSHDIGEETHGTPDFTWLTNDLSFQDAALPVDNEMEAIDCEHNFSLSQPPEPQYVPWQTYVTDKDGGVTSDVRQTHAVPFDINAERLTIEEEIRQKYAEIDNLLQQINEAKQTRRRRRKYQLRKYDAQKYTDGDEWTPSYVNINPIKRQKRPAQPIIKALLTRTAMKAAWNGVLGSCCGRGCWATWKWINLRNVMADYE